MTDHLGLSDSSPREHTEVILDPSVTRPVDDWTTPVRVRGRWADIHVEQLSNGYWLGRVTVKLPQLPEPHVQQNDLFHNAVAAVEWAVGVIDLLTRSV